MGRRKTFTAGLQEVVSKVGAQNQRAKLKTYHRLSLEFKSVEISLFPDHLLKQDIA